MKLIAALSDDCGEVIAFQLPRQRTLQEKLPTAKRSGVSAKRGSQTKRGVLAKIAEPLKSDDEPTTSRAFSR
jgi:hypothetical protein